MHNSRISTGYSDTYDTVVPADRMSTNRCKTLPLLQGNPGPVGPQGAPGMTGPNGINFVPAAVTGSFESTTVDTTELTLEHITPYNIVNIDDTSSTVFTIVESGLYQISISLAIVNTEDGSLGITGNIAINGVNSEVTLVFLIFGSTGDMNCGKVYQCIELLAGDTVEFRAVADSDSTSLVGSSSYSIARLY